jgi:hypothetical protein
MARCTVRGPVGKTARAASASEDKPEACISGQRIQRLSKKKSW